VYMFIVLWPVIYVVSTVTGVRWPLCAKIMIDFKYSVVD
jgi:hypothetical protein